MVAAKRATEFGEGGKIIRRDHFAAEVCDEELVLSDQRADVCQLCVISAISAPLRFTVFPYSLSQRSPRFTQRLTATTRRAKVF